MLTTKILRKNFSQKNINDLILGGGNDAHIMASIMGSKSNITTNICSTFGNEMSILKENLKQSPYGITIKHADKSPDQVGKLNKITNNLEEVVPEADVILFCVPAGFQEMYMRNLEPFLKKGTILGAFPGATCFEIMAADILKNKINDVTIFSGNTLPWACRINEFGKEVNLLGVKETMAIGTTPKKDEKKVCDILQKLLGNKRMEDGILKNSYPVFKTTGILGVTLQNINGLLHPPILCGNMHNLKKDEYLKNDDYYFYQGVTNYTADLLSKVWDELLEIKNHFKKNYPEQDLEKCVHIFDWYKTTYPHTISDNSNLKQCCRTNFAYKGLKYPLMETKNGFRPNYNNRYFQEDLPTGIVAIKGIADLVGIKTPAMDEVIYWAQDLMSKEYIINGKLVGKDLIDSRAPQKYGVKSIEEFMKYYC